MKTILVTGATGFLGKRMIFDLHARGYCVIGTSYSESNAKELERALSRHNIEDVKLYSIDIASNFFLLSRVIKDHNVDYVIHAAALKHVGICEDNPTRAIEVNVLGSRNVLEACLTGNVQNAIAISTDKAVDPVCTYGMTKRLMEEMFLENGFGIFRGVNFLFSSQSVLDIWDKLRASDEKILANKTAIRYFCTVEEIIEKICSSLEKQEIFSIDTCYKISIADLQEAYSRYHNYWNVAEYIPLDIEKTIEALPLGDINIIKPTIDEIVEMIGKFYKNRV
jgi:UDP-N-acetylglucosamine 4,6-dehydratase/5-epimerase